MHYKDYSTADFIQDEFFQSWVYAPDKEKDQYWKAFLLHHPQQRISLEQARDFLLLMNFGREVPDSLLNTVQNRVNEAIDRTEAMLREPGMTGVVVTMGGKTNRRRALRWFYGVAASVAVVASAGLYFFMNTSQKAGFLKTYSAHYHVSSKGKQMFLTLDDSTKVWLNAGSELKYPKDLAASNTREVYLEGEAFFDVSENKEKPFVVNTDKVAITVLGTAFNVKSYPEDAAIETTLVRGSVNIESIEDDDQTVTLSPNQKAVFKKASKKILLEKVAEPDNDTAWKEGWIIIDDKPFSDIIQTLERWYNVSIVIEDENSLQCTFSAKFKDKTIEEVLELFKTTESIEYSIDGNKILMTGRLCEYE